ncbi:hypothetical protein HNQ71_000065 [Mesorhizobium sangaii]|uniref:Uncharacterized protein n=1 Tax=Mesorhizobium sangaii TaxID=505389 RepID=A0A841P1M5_9HYPH|nr:hypothetical protein [Mesorhizobium sangaii]
MGVNKGEKQVPLLRDLPLFLASAIEDDEMADAARAA